METRTVEKGEKWFEHKTESIIRFVVIFQRKSCTWQWRKEKTEPFEVLNRQHFILYFASIFDINLCWVPNFCIGLISDHLIIWFRQRFSCFQPIEKIRELFVYSIDICQRGDSSWRKTFFGKGENKNNAPRINWIWTNVSCLWLINLTCSFVELTSLMQCCRMIWKWRWLERIAGAWIHSNDVEMEFLSRRLALNALIHLIVSERVNLECKWRTECICSMHTFDWNRSTQQAKGAHFQSHSMGHWIGHIHQTTATVLSRSLMKYLVENF